MIQAFLPAKTAPSPHRLLSAPARPSAAAGLGRFLCGAAAFAGLGLLLSSVSAGKAAALPRAFAADGRLWAAAAVLAAGAAAGLALAFIRRQSRQMQALRQRLAEYRQDIAAWADNNSAAAAAENHSGAKQDLLQTLPLILDKVESPLWLRDSKGAVRFANCAYRRLTNSAAGGALPDIEALFSPAHQKAQAEARRKKQDFSGQSNLIVQGNRHIFACRSFYEPQSQSFLELAEDITEKLHFSAEIARIQQGCAETFDRLSTAVAIFNPSRELEFFNAAFAALWPLESRFLESRPSHALLLDRLREKGILNERPDWRQWKDDLFEAYHALTPQHYVWNLPDGRTLRVVANPHPQGGVTWLFDDLTEKLALQARYNSLIRTQGETLDNLSEGVAVFGSDGLLRLANPAFAALWRLPPELAIENTHIEKIRSFCQKRAFGDNSAKAEAENPAQALWRKIALYITGFADKRDFAQGRAELCPGPAAERRCLDYMLAPLPQGQTMLTFADVTDSVNIARALHERNAALESADKLRNDFVRHVSYELRTPLTNIMGFTDLALSPAFGSLSPQQQEYLQHIAGQSALLFNLVNDILDLATVDAGICELNIGSVSIAKAMQDAAERLKPKLEEKNITLERHIAAGLSAFEADEARIRQIFINLLANAAAAAPQNSRIRFTAEKHQNSLAFSVEDEGPGIPPERLADIFKRFTAYAHDGRKTGAGLGLSIVKSFVELHQGHVLAENGKDKGAKLICRFPFRGNEVEKP